MPRTAKRPRRGASRPAFALLHTATPALVCLLLAFAPTTSEAAAVSRAAATVRRDEGFLGASGEEGVAGKCTRHKCQQAVLTSRMLGRYDNCDPTSPRPALSRAGAMLRSARCVEKYVCTAQDRAGLPQSFTVTATRRDTWGGATCEILRARSDGRVATNLDARDRAGATSTAAVGSVCYERRNHHSSLWTFAAPDAVVGGPQQPEGIFIDAGRAVVGTSNDYVTKRTRGKRGAGIALPPETFCACARVKPTYNTIGKIFDALRRYCMYNGGYYAEASNCRHLAGWLYQETTGRAPPALGYTQQCEVNPREDEPLLSANELRAFVDTVTPKGAATTWKHAACPVDQLPARR